MEHPWWIHRLGGCCDSSCPSQPRMGLPAAHQKETRQRGSRVRHSDRLAAATPPNVQRRELQRQRGPECCLGRGLDAGASRQSLHGRSGLPRMWGRPRDARAPRLRMSEMALGEDGRTGGSQRDRRRRACMDFMDRDPYRLPLRLGRCCRCPRRPFPAPTAYTDGSGVHPTDPH